MTCPTCNASTNPSDAHCRVCGTSLIVAPIPVRLNDDLAPGTELNSRYRILERLGRGGFGITYRAFDAQTKSYVAIKELFPDGTTTRHAGGWVVASDQAEMERQRMRMRLEAETLLLLRHQSVTHVCELFDANGTSYLVMEFMGGQTLESRIESGQKLLNIEAREILFVILRVLEELHGLALLHRDIKPANIMLNLEGQGGQRVELIDFGSLVKYRAGQRAKVERLLTPMYAPLEQYGELVELAPATDFYALGATLYHALTLRAPPSAVDRAKGAVLTPIRDLEPAISAGVAGFVMTSLEMRVADRPKNASSALRLLHLGPVQFDPKKDAQQRQKQQIKRRHDQVIILLIPIILIAYVLLLLFFGR